MKFINILILLLVNTYFLAATNPTQKARQNYIDQFSSTAMLEMNRSGIPASIILAQGIVESNSGNSELALDSKNHFGIKCKEWEGRKVYYKDDDLDKNGNLIKSCFRAYDDVLDSYADHSEFLLTGNRYLWLFQLEKTNYRGWAEGLQESGYATNPNYAKMLINIIEEYALYIYDTPQTNWVNTNPTDSQATGQLNVPSTMAIAKNTQASNNQEFTDNDIFLETPTYQLINAPKPKLKQQKRLTLKRAAQQVRAAERPLYHAVAAR